MAWLIQDYEEPGFTREAQDLLDRLERERVALKAVAKQQRAARLGSGIARRSESGKAMTRIVCRTVVTKRGPDGEIQEFERYEQPVKAATQNGHQWPLPDPIIE